MIPTLKRKTSSKSSSKNSIAEVKEDLPKQEGARKRTYSEYQHNDNDLTKIPEVSEREETEIKPKIKIE